jgi:hypothetical protein
MTEEKQETSKKPNPLAQTKQKEITKDKGGLQPTRLPILECAF